MKAEIYVTLKRGVLDPQGKAILGALTSLGVEGFVDIRQGKYFEVELTTGDAAKAEADLKDACEKRLANTVVENYAITMAAPEPAPAAPLTKPKRPRKKKA